MYKKITLLFSCFALMASVAVAQNAALCNAANDSVKAQFARGELGCYLVGKGSAGVVTHIKFSNDRYEKTVVKFGAKDSVLQKKLDILEKSKLKESAGSTDSKPVDKKDSKEGKTNKSDSGDTKKVVKTTDTSVEFKTCYNKAFQAKLDSVFKCDFFRKSDSIMKSYDKLGKGYKNVDFVGGATALQKFMEKNVEIPKDVKASDSDQLIRVYYSFFVDEKGAVSDIKLTKSNCKECEQPVLTAIKKLPAFIPATEAGRPKKVKYILPYTKKI